MDLIISESYAREHHSETQLKIYDNRTSKSQESRSTNFLFFYKIYFKIIYESEISNT